MKTECITEAMTVEEAVDAALEELGVQQDAVGYEVLQEPGRGVFGIGSGKPARVRVWLLESPEEPQVEDEESLDEDDMSEEVPPELQADADLTDEDLDLVADAATASLKRVVQAFGIEDPQIEEYEGDDREIILDLIGADLGLLIGRHGKTLDALQTLVAAITTKKLGFRHPVVVDVEGYRHRRRQKLEEIARRAADRASKQHAPVRLRPMTAYERRIVHVALRGDKRITTGSEGADPYRQVVIRPR